MTTRTLSGDVRTTPYPVSLVLTPVLTQRNRLTTALRPVLAIPHTLLVGPAAWLHRSGAAGLLGSAAYVLAIVNWFAILIFGDDIKGIRDFQRYYLGWRTRALAYMTLLVDDYPPFGDAPYPAGLELIAPPVHRDRVTIALRPLLVMPHAVVLVFILFAWLVATVIAWLGILFTDEYPAALLPFSVGAMRWLLRVEAYALLLVDDYPPFTLE